MRLEPSKLVALAYVADVSASIAFYERLGFRVTNSFADEDERGLLWAALTCGSAALMVSRASAPVVASEQAILFYLAAYMFMNLGAFTVAGLIYRQTGSEDINDYAGLGRRAPVAAACMTAGTHAAPARL